MEHFDELNQYSKLSYLYKEGVLLRDFRVKKFIVHQFLMEDCFAEVWLMAKTSQVLKIRTFGLRDQFKVLAKRFQMQEQLESERLN